MSKRIDCSNVVNFFKERDRLTNNCHMECGDCPLASGNNGTSHSCTYLIFNHTEKAVEILQKWSDRNPVKTRLDDFTEKYPNHTTCGKGYPHACCLRLGYTRDCDDDCNKCWDMPL